MLSKFTDHCFIKSLTLSKCVLNEVSVDFLSYMLTKSAHSLIELDISWNKIGSIQITKILKALEYNRNFNT